MCVKIGARELSNLGQNQIVRKVTVAIFYGKFASRVDDNECPANGIVGHYFCRLGFISK